MIIAEIGLNHLGQLDEAYNLFNSAILSGVDAITFQIREESFYTNQFFSQIKLPIEVYKNMCIKAHKHNIKFGLALSNPSMISFFEDINIDFYKILSKDLSNDIVLEAFNSRTDKKLYVSTGMSNIETIKNAMKKLNNSKVTLIHTRLSSDPEDANLKAISTMKKEFGDIVSYGHHCDNLNVLFAAQSFEPKDTFLYIKGNKNVLYPDHQHAIPVDQLKYYVDNLKIIVKSLGNGIKSKSKNNIKGQI